MSVKDMHQPGVARLCRSAVKAKRAVLAAVVGTLLALVSPTVAVASMSANTGAGASAGANMSVSANAGDGQKIVAAAPAPRAAVSPDTLLVSPGVGQWVNGWLPPSTFNPLDGYPATIPDGSTFKSSGFAGTVVIKDSVTGETGLAYCIQINVGTQNGAGYDFTDWSGTDIPNLGYVTYILQHYYPTTDEPTSAPTDKDRNSSVQAAIWHFTDSSILATDSPIRSLTEGIVADALANGPSAEPTLPTIAVTPDTLPAPETGEIVGPFTVTGNGPATITIGTGIEVFTDAAGTNQLHTGDTVTPTAQLWARTISSSAPQDFTLTRTVTEPVGAVLLYTHNISGLDEAQALILAKTGQFTVQASAALEPFPAGALKVVKRVEGKGAGLQDEFVLDVNCVNANTDLNQRYTLTLSAGAPAGDYQATLTGVFAGSVCTTTETSNGGNQYVDLVRTDIDPRTVTIVANETQQVTVTDKYEKKKCSKDWGGKWSPRECGKQPWNWSSSNWSSSGWSSGGW